MPGFFSCFRSPDDHLVDHLSPPPEPPTLTSPSLSTTSLYRTELGLATITWCTGAIAGASHIELSLDPHEHDPSLSFRVLLKPFLFWNKRGSKKLDLKNTTRRVRVFWDLSRAKFSSGPEPQSGFYVAVVVDGEMTLLVGDRENEAYAKSKARRFTEKRTQILVLRRENVFVSESYEAKATFGGESKSISIDCSVDDDSMLGFSLDRKKLLQVKRLEWKFRGNERVEIDGVRIDVAWDVYNWLFDGGVDGPAIFTFRFDRIGTEDDEEEEGVLWQQISGLETNELKKKKQQKESSCKIGSSSSSSFSSSSASSGSNSSVLEWASSEELQSVTTGFTLLVFAWKST